MLDQLMDAFGYAADSLDKLGPRPLRGLLAGKPREALSFLPFSDAFGLTDPKDIRSGRHVTDYLGATNPHDRGLGAGAAGLLADLVIDPLALAGGAKLAFKGARGLHHGLMGTARGLVRHPQVNMGAPFLPSDVERLTGRRPAHLGFDEAESAYKPWQQALLPEEQGAIGAYTASPQERISHALRGASEHEIDPFYSTQFGLPRGIPPLHAHEDVHREIVPYLDSALSRGAAPRDTMTYRINQRLGELRPENAERMLGRTISDPSYLSTTITPWERFYGQSASPKDLLMDILMPKGSPGGYLEGMSGWKGEHELLLPRAAQLRVAGLQKNPVQEIGRQWYRLDPAGKPMPMAGHHGSPLFTENAADAFYRDVATQGAFGDIAVPDELMAPGWRDYLRNNLQSEGQQTNVLAELLPGTPAAHRPAVGRLTPKEIVEELSRQAQTWKPGSGVEETPSFSNMKKAIEALVGRSAKRGLYPEASDLEILERYGLKTGELLRSRPR